MSCDSGAAAASRLLSTVLVEGHFPKYEDVIPKSSDKRAKLDREEPDYKS